MMDVKQITILGNTHIDKMKKEEISKIAKETLRECGIEMEKEKLKGYTNKHIKIDSDVDVPRKVWLKEKPLDFVKEGIKALEEKPLSEKMLKCVCGNDDENRRLLLHSKDVKEAVEKLKEDIQVICDGITQAKIYSKIDKIFGDLK